jgi:hypothetical protein
VFTRRPTAVTPPIDTGTSPGIRPQSFSDFHAAVEKTDLRSGNSDTLWGVRGSVAQTSLVSPNLFSGSGSASGDSYALFGLAIDHGFSISTFEVTFEILTPQRFELAAEVSGFSTPILTGYGNAAVMLTGPTSFQVFAGTSYGRIPSASLDVNGLLQPGSYHFFAYADAITVGNRDEDVPVVEDNSASASFDFLFRLIEPTGVPDPDVSLSTYLAVFFALGLLFPKRPGETA